MWARSFPGSSAILGAVAVVACLAMACSNTGAFQPRTPTGRAGLTRAAATYDVKVGAEAVGTAKVWTETTAEPRSIDVSVELQNRTREPLDVDVAQSSLAVSTRSAGTVVVQSPARTHGSSVASPQESTEVKLAYALPASVSPRDVTGYRFDWQVRGPRGSYRQSTEFTREAIGKEPTACAFIYGAPQPGYGSCGTLLYQDPNDPTMPLTVPSSR